jgi:hypothetical protein
VNKIVGGPDSISLHSVYSNQDSLALRRVCQPTALLCSDMAKAARVLAALKRDGWIETRRSGSHRVLAKGSSSGSGPTMTVWTSAARPWPGSPGTTGTPLLNCGNYRTIFP